MGRRKFNEGDKVIGNNIKGSFWGRRGIVIGYWTLTGEYIVRFDDGKEEYVNPIWLDPDNLQDKD